MNFEFIPEGYKRCSGRHGCFLIKPLGEFHCYRRQGQLRPQSKCKECAAKRIQLWRKQVQYTNQERKRRAARGPSGSPKAKSKVRKRTPYLRP